MSREVDSETDVPPHVLRAFGADATPDVRRYAPVVDALPLPVE